MIRTVEHSLFYLSSNVSVSTRSNSQLNMLVLTYMETLSIKVKCVETLQDEYSV